MTDRANDLARTITEGKRNTVLFCAAVVCAAWLVLAVTDRGMDPLLLTFWITAIMIAAALFFCFLWRRVETAAIVLLREWAAVVLASSGGGAGAA